MMKTAVDVCEKLVALYDAGVRPQVIKGMHREEEEFVECVKRARVLVEWRRKKAANIDRADYAHSCAMADSYPDGQGA